MRASTTSAASGCWKPTATVSTLTRRGRLLANDVVARLLVALDVRAGPARWHSVESSANGPRRAQVGNPPGDRRGARRDGAAGRLADRRAFSRHERLERHRAQRDDRARARRLHRGAAHVGRADPHRPRLPLLRRPLHAPGRTPRSAEARGVRLLHAVHVGEPGARRSAARDEPTPRARELAHRRRRRPALARRGRDRPERAARQPPALARARARDPVQRQRREVRAAPRRRGRRRDRGGGGHRARRAAHRPRVGRASPTR